MSTTQHIFQINSFKKILLFQYISYTTYEGHSNMQ
jgi:hypothetical protein